MQAYHTAAEYHFYHTIALLVVGVLLAKLDTSKVLIHSTVEVKNQTNKQTVKYKLVAQSEADLASGKISVESPIGKGLLGKSVGEVAEITVPNGTIGLEVLSITRN